MRKQYKSDFYNYLYILILITSWNLMIKVIFTDENDVMNETCAIYV